MTLTPRETQVLGLLADGHTGKHAARKLGISHRTVEAHVFNAKEKLGARTYCHAVAMFVKGQAA